MSTKNAYVLTRKIDLLFSVIIRLLRRGADKNLSKIVQKTHPADLALIFERIDEADQLKLINLITDLQHRSDVISELEADTKIRLIKQMEIIQIRELIPFLESDDTVELFRELPPEISDEILRGLKSEDAEQLVDLLGYPEDSAGGIMNPEIFSVESSKTVKEVIEILQQTPDVEMVFYIYVVNSNKDLVGVLSLRKLLLVKPETKISEIMTQDVIRVRPDVTQEEVAKVIERYDLLAIPVVTENNKLLGAITVDDIIDVIHEEATEDMLKMAGAGGSDIINKSVFTNIKNRIPWLIASGLGGIIAFLIIRYFEKPLENFIFLAAFIPLLMGTSGNVGTQTSTIVIRSIALGTITQGKLFNIVIKELLIGTFLGFFLGTCIGFAASFIYTEALYVGYIISVSLTLSLMISAFLGAVYPLVFNRLKIDPALATAPFVTTTIDIVSIINYFLIAKLFLNF